MGLEEIIQRILAFNRDLTREEVLRMIDEKKRAAEGFFTEKAAARIVASELGMEVWRESFRPEVLIRDLVSGLNDVTVVGYIIVVNPPQTFTRTDKTEGKFAHLVISDKSGTMKVVLWDDKADLVRGVKKGRIVKVSHGYVREGRDGRLELHVGLHGDVQAITPGVESEYPSITRFIQKIGGITRKHKSASILGVLENIYPVSEFKRRDGTRGKMTRIDLRDDTGQITAFFWNEKVDELGDVKRGDYLQIVNARVKERLDSRPELHVESATYIEFPTETPSILYAPHTQFAKINKLGPKMCVNILARVTHVGEVREFRRSNGEIGQVSTLLIRDETGLIHLNLWADKATVSSQIQPGDIVLVREAYTRERFGKINLNLGRRGTLKLNPSMSEAELPPYKEEKTKIADIMEGGPITVVGDLVTMPGIREVVTRRGDKVTVASFDLTDETGKIRVSIWKRLVDAVRDLPIGTRIKIQNAYVKKGFLDQLELTSYSLTSVKVLSKPEKAA